jgi:hypothetical protein
MDFQTQMNFVKERNQIKYENRLMLEEDKESRTYQQLFKKERLKDEQRKNQIEMEELKKIQQKILEEDEIREKNEMHQFISNYVITKLSINTDRDIDDIRNEAINIYYDRKLREQQNEEYKKSCESDLNKFKY